MSDVLSIYEIADLNKNSITAKDNFSFIYYLDTSSLTKNKVDSLQFLESDFPSRAKRKVTINTILYSTVRPNQEHFGIIENQTADNLIASTGFTTIDIVSSKINAKYLYYKLIQPFVTNYLQGIAENSVSAYPSIKPEAIGNLRFSFPNLLTQQKIASVLSALDDKIELNNRINDNFERMAKTLYDYWFVQFDFPDENGKPYKSSGGKMVWNEILKREIPIDWEFQTIEELGTITGGSTPSKAIEDNFSKNGIPWITPKDLSQNIGNKFITRGEFDVTKKGLKEASLNILPANSVLMSSRAPIGYLAINRFNCATNQGFKSIVCNKEYPFEYVFYVLKHNMLSIEANASGSTFKEISTAVLKRIKILKPQKRLVNQFKNIASVLFQQQNNLEQQNQQLSSLRDWLLPMLMNGQVKVE